MNPRKERLSEALRNANLQGLVCSLPKNVLLASGYWPVVGTSMAVVTEDGEVSLCVPEDEEELAKHGWADRVQTFQPSSLKELTTAAEEIVGALQKLCPKLKGRIAVERNEDTEPASYAAMHLYKGSVHRILSAAFPDSQTVSGDALLRQLRAVKTEGEIASIKTACKLAERAFTRGATHLRAGLTELEAAEAFRMEYVHAVSDFDVQRANAFVWAMSGANSAKAHGAYARSRTKKLQSGDLVLVHCNSYADGYWTDITRTFSLGDVKDKRSEIHPAIFAARQAAFEEIRKGNQAATVDHAARGVLDSWGFGKEFKHSTGHGVGFGAISPDALPRLHPKSPDVLEPGMVFNVEPAVYIDGFGGIRHCDMIAVTANGCELLTDFQCRIEDLILNS